MSNKSYKSLFYYYWANWAWIMYWQKKRNQLKKNAQGRPTSLASEPSKVRLYKKCVLCYLFDGLLSV